MVRASHVLQPADDFDGFRLVLDGVMQRGGERPDGALRGVGPLPAWSTAAGGLNGSAVHSDFTGYARCLASHTGEQPPGGWECETDRRKVLDQRLRRLCDWVQPLSAEWLAEPRAAR
jgi:hypothetical protein